MSRSEWHTVNVTDKLTNVDRSRSTIAIDDLEKNLTRTSSENEKCPTQRATGVPPDGGYGYVIVFAAFMSNVIVDGILYSYASLKDSIYEDFKQQTVFGSNAMDKATVTWIGSILTGFYCFTGPFVAVAINKLGFRVVAMTGSIIVTTGFVLASYTNLGGANMLYLCAFYGVMGGTGFSCIFVPAVVSVGFYFEKRRALATGIAVCGSGVGTFIFPPLIDLMISRWQWQGAILGLGVIVLSCALLGILYQPLKSPDSEKGPQTTAPTQMVKSRRGIRQFKISFRSEDTIKRFPIFSQLKTFLRGGRTTPEPQITQVTLNKPVHLDDCVHPINFYVIPDAAQNTTTTSPSCPIPNGDSSRRLKSPCGAILWKTINDIFDFSLLLSPCYLMLAMSNMFAMLGVFVPFVYLMDQAQFILSEKENTPEKSAFTLLLSMIGAADIVGRILSGWLADCPGISALVLNNIALTLMAVSAGAVPFLTEYYHFLLFSVVFGFSLACFNSLRSILLIEFVGLNRLTNAFGLIMIFIGIGATVAAPTAGTLANLAGCTDDFSVAFFFAGGCLLFSAVICYPLNIVNTMQSQK